MSEDAIRKIAVILIILVIPVCAGAQEQEAPADTDSDLVMLRDLAARFERDGLQLTVLDAALGALRAQEDPSWRDIVAQTKELLDASNAPYDLAAPPVPTDDALYNRYARAVDQRINFALRGDEALPTQMSLSGLSDDIFAQALLPEDQLDEWESEWRNDPRYWELRAFTVLCRRATDDPPEIKSDERDSTAQKVERLQRTRDLLEQAQQRGAVRGQTLLLLYRVLTELEDLELAPLTTYETMRYSAIGQDNPTGLPRRPEFTAEQLAQSAELHARYDNAELAMLDEAVSVDPDLAWAHYCRAFYWFDHGEAGRGLMDMAAGNTAPDLRFPLPFPMDIAFASFDAEEPAGSAAVVGAIGLSSINYDFMMPPWSDIKELLNDQFVTINLNGDAAALDAWHQFACRVPFAEQGNSIFQIQPYVYIGMIRDFVWEQPRRNNTQTEAVKHLMGWQIAYRKAPQPYGVPDIELAMVLGLAGEMHGICVAFYVSQSAILEINKGNLHFFEDAAQLRYTNLVLPEALAEYEAITPDQWRLNVSATKQARRIVKDTRQEAHEFSSSVSDGR